MRVHFISLELKGEPFTFPAWSAINISIRVESLKSNFTAINFSCNYGRTLFLFSWNDVFYLAQPQHHFHNDKRSSKNENIYLSVSRQPVEKNTHREASRGRKNIMKLHTILRVPKDKLFRPLDLPGNKTGGPGKWAPESGSSECFHLKTNKICSPSWDLVGWKIHLSLQRSSLPLQRHFFPYSYQQCGKLTKWMLSKVSNGDGK